jgi:hypothetical protein
MMLGFLWERWAGVSCRGAGPHSSRQSITSSVRHSCQRNCQRAVCAGMVPRVCGWACVGQRLRLQAREAITENHGVDSSILSLATSSFSCTARCSVALQ